MRLLHCRRLLEGEVAADAIQSFDGDPPPYAILSHTWGRDEVSLKDLAQTGVSRKAGYTKIRYCCEQSLRDKLEFAWVDTCCIDKASSAELSEAINSMFRWYLEAKVCYAYLEDVAVTGQDDSWLHRDFASSRWFTRGWTLQELLAPDTVVFYTASWQKIGSKTELIDTISRITNVDRSFLYPGAASHLKSASIAQKMSWAAKRTTTRVEDIAYSLLGIFEISMPLLYGEGTGAFTRLQEELMKQYHDHSMFAWGISGSGRRGGLLARSPTDFLGCEYITSFNQQSNTLAPTRIPQGVRIQLYLHRHHAEDTKATNRTPRHFALLNCNRKYDLQSVVAIPLHPADAESTYYRDGGPVIHVTPSYGLLQRPKSVHIMDNPPDNGELEKFDVLYQHLSLGRRRPENLVWIQQLPKGYRVVEVLPPTSWYPTNTIEMCWPWHEHTDDARLVKMLDANGDRAVILALTIRRSLSFLGYLCPFAIGKPSPSCLATVVDHTQSLDDIANSMNSLTWQQELWVSGLGCLMVDIRQTQSRKGWEMLALRVYAVQGIELWRVRARKLVTWLVSQSLERAIVDLLFIFLLLLVAGVSCFGVHVVCACFLLVIS